MMRQSFPAAQAGLLIVLVIAASGCQNMNHTQQGAGLGAALGGLTGAIIGHQSGNRDLGALVGAGTGGVAGGLVGNAQDMREQRDAAIVEAHHQRQRRRAAERALTNADIAMMSRNGLSDDVIIGAITERGGRFNTSPDQLIQLSNSGVSQVVIGAMQRYSATQR